MHLSSPQLPHHLAMFLCQEVHMIGYRLPWSGRYHDWFAMVFKQLHVSSVELHASQRLIDGRAMLTCKLLERSGLGTRLLEPVHVVWMVEACFLFPEMLNQE